MFPILFLIMLIVPVIEIGLFIEVGSLIGLWPTLLTVVVTAIMGTTLLRVQGMATLAEAQKSVNDGAIPLEPAIHGAFLLVAGIVLLTPGFLTDAIGLALFIPPLRLWLGRKVFAWVKKHGTVVMMNQQGFTASHQGEPFTGEPFTAEHNQRFNETVVDLGADAFSDDMSAPNPDSPWSDERAGDQTVDLADETKRID